MRLKRKAFTLIELVMIIVILGILAVVAIPKFVDLSSEAEDAAEKGVVGAVRAGIAAAFAQSSTKPKTYPTALDSIATSNTNCTTNDPCFDTVLAQGGIVDNSWIKIDSDTYEGPTGTQYDYNSSDGSFMTP